MSAEQQFADKAEKYRDEAVFAVGNDLTWMVECIPLTGSEKLLDIGAGAGHTALAFATQVAEVYGLDVTPAMVEVATKLAADRGVKNATFQVGDVERLPFPDQFFDIVTCRLAAHHFVDIQQSFKEITRVLKPGGSFLLVDHYAPEEEEQDHFINRLDQLRDPSHVREYKLSEWRSFFEENQLEYREVKHWHISLQFDNWVERSATPEDTRQKLIQMLQQATAKQKELFQIELDQTGHPKSFSLLSVLIQGVKS
nr:class I SAM-dependent methyltransferase [Seinonella peptonophila]